MGSSPPSVSSTMVTPEANRPIEIYSNFSSWSRLLANRSDIRHTLIDADTSVMRTLWFLLKVGRRADFLVLNLDHRRLYLACIIFMIAFPRSFRRCRLISVDILLRPVSGTKGRLVQMAKIFLLRQVDLFVLYFRNIDGYLKHYKLDRKRIIHVPFKVNSSLKLHQKRMAGVPEGDYALLAGVTLRDHATFVEAVRKAGVPAVLLLHPGMRDQVGNLAWYKSCPANLRIEFHEDGKESTYLGYFERAKVVCLPRYKWDIASTGISALFCSFGLGKCVLISKGPGAEDILTQGQALFFEPEDVDSLAALIRRVWDDNALRRRVGAAAAEFADCVQGEDRLLRDILDGMLASFTRHQG
jgi:glycosyltransferase involved in cell wall biosynthesis